MHYIVIKESEKIKISPTARTEYVRIVDVAVMSTQMNVFEMVGE